MPISDRVKRLLWSRSGGYCQNPNCRDDFFTYFENGEITSIEELAHVIAQSNEGPRGSNPLPLAQRDEYNNIILLCPKCHSLIDKNPIQFPEEMLIDWKLKHVQILQQAFVVPVYSDRKILSVEIHKLLRRNHQIYLSYGPNSEHIDNPLTDAATVWNRYIHSDVLPNNRKIANLLLVNEHLLSSAEKTVLDKFIIHQEAFEFNHVSGDKTSVAPLFPAEINQILIEE